MIPNLLICVVTETLTDDFDLPIRRNLCIEILLRPTALFIAHVLFPTYKDLASKYLKKTSKLHLPFIEMPKKAFFLHAADKLSTLPAKGFVSYRYLPDKYRSP